MATAVHSQDSARQFVEGAKPSAAQILFLLNSQDPRIEAWGATYARGSADDKVEEKLEALAEDWPGSDATDLGQQRRDAMFAVLDAVLVHRGKLPADVLSALDPDFPVQAAMLAARLPTDINVALLQSWFESGTQSDTPTLEARVAGMLLAKDPPGGFAAQLLIASEADVTLQVTAPQPGQNAWSPDSSYSFGCSHEKGENARAGWPAIFTYSTTSGGEEAAVIVEVAGERMYAERHGLSAGSDSCGRKQTTARLRHLLLAAMLGMRDREMARRYWPMQTRRVLGAITTAQYAEYVPEFVTSEENQFNACVQALHAKGFLTDEEAGTVRPKLRILIDDRRGTDADPLPELTFGDARTTLAVVQVSASP